MVAPGGCGLTQAGSSQAPLLRQHAHIYAGKAYSHKIRRVLEIRVNIDAGSNLVWRSSGGVCIQPQQITISEVIHSSDVQLPERTHDEPDTWVPSLYLAQLSFSHCLARTSRNDVQVAAVAVTGLGNCAPIHQPQVTTGFGLH